MRWAQHWSSPPGFLKWLKSKGSWRLSGQEDIMSDSKANTFGKPPDLSSKGPNCKINIIIPTVVQGLIQHCPQCWMLCLFLVYIAKLTYLELSPWPGDPWEVEKTRSQPMAWRVLDSNNPWENTGLRGTSVSCKEFSKVSGWVSSPLLCLLPHGWVSPGWSKEREHKTSLTNPELFVHSSIGFPVILAHNFSCGVSAKQQLGVDSQPAAAC